MLKTKAEALTKSKVDPNMLNALKNIIRICKKKNISLFIVYSPIFHSMNEKQSPPSITAKLSLEIINQEKVNYCDFSYDPVFAGRMDLFADISHLNEDGAKVFSKMLINKIRQNN